MLFRSTRANDAGADDACESGTDAQAAAIAQLLVRQVGGLVVRGHLLVIGNSVFVSSFPATPRIACRIIQRTLDLLLLS